MESQKGLISLTLWITTKTNIITFVVIHRSAICKTFWASIVWFDLCFHTHPSIWGYIYLSFLKGAIAKMPIFVIPSACSCFRFSVTPCVIVITNSSATNKITTTHEIPKPINHFSTLSTSMSHRLQKRINAVPVSQQPKLWLHLFMSNPIILI